ncbi:MAG: RidA family protein [Planctomyces sp.]
MTTPQICRIGDSPRWADIVIYQGIARWVEVASDLSAPAATQIRQVLSQIDATLAQIGSSRESLLQIIIHLADLADAAELNQQWDQWVPPGHAPVRACVQSGLGGGCKVEMIITAAVS